MSQYTINFSCGHTETRQIYGKTSLRQDKADWMAQGICSECYTAQKQVERQAKESEQLAAEKLVFADLEGSEKQIAWAEKIRAEMLDKVTKLKNEAIEYLKRESLTAIDREKGRIIIEEAFPNCFKGIATQAHAAWFIDNRGALAQKLLQQLAPSYVEKIQAIDAREADRIEIENQPKIESIERQLIKLEAQKVAAVDELASRSEEIEPEYTALQAICDSWSDEKIEGDWDEEMNANGNRRSELESYVYESELKVKEIQSKINTLEGELKALQQK